MELEAIELQLARSTYARVAEKLRPFSDDDLFMLLDSKSVRIGDTAAELLAERKQHGALIDAILNSRIKTALGRVRASNMLLWSGRKVPQAELAYLHLLGDKSAHVVSNALFGLVFLQNENNIPAIETARASAKPGSKTIEYYDRAIEALNREDPFFYSPHFADLNGIWQLGRRRSSDPANSMDE